MNTSAHQNRGLGCLLDYQGMIVMVCVNRYIRNIAKEQQHKINSVKLSFIANSWSSTPQRIASQRQYVLLSWTDETSSMLTHWFGSTIMS